MKYRIVEFFSSINGEGMKAGELAFFVRFAGCNLSCSYCDTTYANEKSAKFTWMDKSQIIDRILESGITNITLTGGEPLIQEGIKELTEAVCGYKNLEVEIETNGSIDILELRNGTSFDNLSFTIDYKLPGSGMELYMCESNFKNVSEYDTVKFVVSDKKDLEKSLEVIEKYNLYNSCKICLSPVFGKIKPEEIVKFMLLHRMNKARLSLQLHKIIWDPYKRGV